MDIEGIYNFAVRKGVNVLGTGDALFPKWHKEIVNEIEPCGNGLFAYKTINFILTAEVNLVFESRGKDRGIHLVLTFPDFCSVDALSRALNVDFDKSARPTIYLTAYQFVNLAKKINPRINIIPAHIWTPWFGVLGSRHGFDSIEECFEEETLSVTGLETGLSSDPLLSYSVENVRSFTMISSSDAHSPSRIGREATVLKGVEGYDDIFNSIKNADKEKFVFTIEEFPEQGKYFADGHKKCHYSKLGFTNNEFCPICGKKLTIGVWHRIMQLSDAENPSRFIKIPFIHLLPLRDVIAQAFKVGKLAKKVETEYNKGVEAFYNELNILVFTSLNEIRSVFPENIVKAIDALRKERVKKVPGYDGVYGKIILEA